MAAYITRTGASYVFLLLLVSIHCPECNGQYDPTWDSLDKRPLPQWYDEAKVGIFINWGVYSVPSFDSEWFWWQWKGEHITYVEEFMRNNYPPGFTYADFAPMLTAEFFDPDQWADIISASGARYVVLSSKHHEGFTMWPSNVSFNWNSLDVGPKRDLVGPLANSLRSRTKIHFGIYHSLFEWFHPQYLADKHNRFHSQNFVKTKAMPELYELVHAYKPDVLWSDGQWEASSAYWNSTEFIAWLYNDSPVKNTVVTNDRWGSDTMCKHGGFYTCHDRYNPGKLQTHKWENAMTIDRKSWGYRRNAQLNSYLSIQELITLVAETVSCGGNILINIGPSHDGLIKPIYEERLRQLGKWLGVNGEAIYSSTPWSHQNDTVTKRVWYTAQKTEPGTAYAILLDWPDTDVLKLGSPDPGPSTEITMLGYNGTFTWSKLPTGGVAIAIPPISFSMMPCDWAWVFKLTNLQN